MLYEDCERCVSSGIVWGEGINHLRHLADKCPDCHGRGVVPVEVATNAQALAREAFDVYGLTRAEFDAAVINLAAKIAAFCNAEAEKREEWVLAQDDLVTRGEYDSVWEYNERIKGDNTRLREALGFYADQKNWEEGGGQVKVSPIDLDVGDRAKDALEKL